MKRGKPPLRGLDVWIDLVIKEEAQDTRYFRSIAVEIGGSNCRVQAAEAVLITEAGVGSEGEAVFHQSYLAIAACEKEYGCIKRVCLEIVLMRLGYIWWLAIPHGEQP